MRVLNRPGRTCNPASHPAVVVLGSKRRCGFVIKLFCFSCCATFNKNCFPGPGRPGWIRLRCGVAVMRFLRGLCCGVFFWFFFDAVLKNWKWELMSFVALFCQTTIRAAPPYSLLQLSACAFRASESLLLCFLTSAQNQQNLLAKPRSGPSSSDS